MRRMASRRRTALAAAIALLCGCGSGRQAPAPSPSATVAASCAQRVLASMTEDQRVGQLFSLGLANDQLGSDERGAIGSLHLGSVWFVGNTQGGVAAVRSVADAAQAQATGAATAGVRLFVAANQEGGQVQALNGPGFSRIPPAVAQGGVAASALQGDAAGWGRELVAAGVNMNFAPVMDVVPPGTDARNQPIGVLQREYGHDPATAGSHGAAFVHGMSQAGVATTVKHFPGLGQVEGNTDFTANVVDSTTGPDDPSLGSFRQGIEAGAPFVMVALATYQRIDPAHRAVFSPSVMRLLRDDLGFGGVILSDDLGATQAVATMAPEQRALDFLAAGGDVVVSRPLAATVRMVEAVRARAASDTAFRFLVDDAALRVLRAKQAYGLLPCASRTRASAATTSVVAQSGRTTPGQPQRPYVAASSGAAAAPPT
jgi:beta-N-acetylhexosaminidase